MQGKLILRGGLAGLVAGLVAFVFARIFAEPHISAAIDYESGRDDAQNALLKAAGKSVDAEGPDIFSRTVQANIGIGVGMVLFGLAMGLLFAIAYSFCLGRFGRTSARALALIVAGCGFVSMYFVPFLRYPANPPAIGHEETIRARSNLYITIMVASVLFMVLAAFLGHRLRPRLGVWNAWLISALAYVVAVGIVMVLLPNLGDLADNVAEYGHHATETPQPLTDSHGKIVYPGFPADVLASFRLYSVLAQALLWATIGVVFAPMAERVLGGATRIED